jgi:hypothetical protein
MRRERMRIGAVIGTGLLAVLGMTAVSAGQARTEVVDCLAAVVNGEVITLADVRIAEAFGLAEALDVGTGADPRRVILEKLIDRKVVIDLAGDRATSDPGRVQTELDRIAARLGEAGLRQRLDAFGLIFENLRPYAEEKARAETIIANRFGRSVTVSLKEIETAYATRYAPAEKKAGRTPRPLIEIVEAIETDLRAAKIQEQSALWILNLRDQAEIEIHPDCLKK